jgi:hypothetical protein
MPQQNFENKNFQILSDYHIALLPMNAVTDYFYAVGNLADNF